MGIQINGQTDTISATDGDFTLDGTVANVKAFASGTLMLFQQTTAPTGWTKQTTHNNKALRVVSGAASSGGSTAFTSVFASRTPGGTVTMSNAAVTLTESQIPSHTHSTSIDSATCVSSVVETRFVRGGCSTSSTPSFTSSSTGSSSSHTHSNTASFTGTAMDFDIQYVDLIIASKD